MSVAQAKATASAPVNDGYKSGTAEVEDRYSGGTLYITVFLVRGITIMPSSIVTPVTM